MPDSSQVLDPTIERGGDPILPTIEIAAIVMGEKGDVLIGRAKEGLDKDKLSVPMSRLQPFESLGEGARRTVLEWSGVDVTPQYAIFVCEAIHPEQETHRVVVFVFAKKLKRVSDGGDSLWIDVRKLGDYQEEMTDLTIDGFQKFSLVLRGMRNTALAAVDEGPKQA
jgi:ADP-ribose pyrophosphatase YjhB (NUDIX family)